MKRIQEKDSKSISTRMYIGIDNGVSGTIGWSGNLHNGESCFGQIPMPVRRELSYTKEKKHINRVLFSELKQVLYNCSNSYNALVLIERPMVNSTRFNASLSAIRCLESTLIALEELNLPHQYIDSRQWQSIMLPKGLKGSDQLKKASIDIGRRLFPSVVCKPDADGILIAEWARRAKL